MAASDECTHLTENLTKGPLAGINGTERDELITEKTNQMLWPVSENAAAGYNYAEQLVLGWYHSSLHKAALLDKIELPGCGMVSEMAVAGADRGDGYLYWAQRSCKEK